MVHQQQLYKTGGKRSKKWMEEPWSVRFIQGEGYSMPSIIFPDEDNPSMIEEWRPISSCRAKEVSWHFQRSPMLIEEK